MLAGCAGEPLDCGLYERGSSDFRHCRASEGSKEFMFRLGVEKYVLGDYEAAEEWLKRALKNEVLKSHAEVPIPGRSINDTIRYEDVKLREKGIGAAGYILSMMYRDGKGVSKSADRAQRYLEQAGNTIIEFEDKQSQYIAHVKNRGFYPEEDGSYRYFPVYSFNIVKED